MLVEVCLGDGGRRCFVQVFQGLGGGRPSEQACEAGRGRLPEAQRSTFPP